MSLADWGKRLVNELQAERRAPPHERVTQADDVQITAAVELVERMVRHLEAGALPPVDRRWPELCRLVVESWRPEATLSKELCDFEDAYRRYPTPVSRADGRGDSRRV